MKSPPYTKLTLDLYRKLPGLVLDKVEFWNSFARKRKDLFGCIDIVALTPKGYILGIQSTSGNCHSGHKKKILAEPRIKRWLECGGKFHLISWTKVKNRWKPRIEDITKDMFNVKLASRTGIPKVLGLTGRKNPKRRKDAKRN